MTELITVIAFNVLAFWQRHIFLYMMASIVDVVYGLLLAAANTVYGSVWIEGVVVAILGFFCLYRTVMKLIGKEDNVSKP